MNLWKLGTKSIDINIFKFALVDFANSIYVLVFLSFIFPLYLKDILPNSLNVDLVWSIILSGSIVSGLLLAPFTGQLADRINKKIFLGVLTVVVFCLLIIVGLLQESNYILISICFWVANMLFGLSLPVYDSILKHIVRHENLVRASSFAWGFGYLGGVFILCVFLFLDRQSDVFYDVAIIISSITYFLVSFGAILAFPNFKKNDFKTEFRIKKMFKLFFKREYIVLFIIVFLLNDSIDTIVFFTSLFSTETLKLSLDQIVIFYVSVQILAFPATWIMGIFANKWGDVFIFRVTIILWIFIIILLAISTQIYHLIIISFFISFVIGSSKSIFRGIYAKKITETESATYFSFFSIFSRSASLIGPVIFGLISTISGSQRIAILYPIIPFIIVLFLLKKYRNVISD